MTMTKNEIDPRDWTTDDFPKGGGAEAARQRMVFRNVHRSKTDPDIDRKRHDALREYLKSHDEYGRIRPSKNNK